MPSSTLVPAYFAPADLGPWVGLTAGMAYLVVCWFFAGLYLSCVIHMGIAHRALDYQEWFVKSLTLVNNAFGVYIDPITWVNRHRLHHKYADHAGDPNKLAADGLENAVLCTSRTRPTSTSPTTPSCRPGPCPGGNPCSRGDAVVISSAVVAWAPPSRRLRAGTRLFAV